LRHEKLDLPPPYTELALREAFDAFERATAEAEAGAGAGLLVWVRRMGHVDCAVVLEPEEKLAEAQHVILAGMAAIADALAAISPPEKPLTLVWPDRVMFDGGLVGGARLAWPVDCGPREVPAWLVFGFSLRTIADTEPGQTPAAALVDDGFDDFENGPFIESFARHFMLALDEWQQGGKKAALASFRRYGKSAKGDLAAALASPSWRDGDEIGR
jgi:hypothetical protein